MANFIRSGAAQTLSRVVFGVSIFFFITAIVVFIFIMMKCGENKDAIFHASAYFISTCLLLCASMLTSFSSLKVANPSRPDKVEISTQNVGLLINGILPIIEVIGLVALLAYVAFLVYQAIKFYKENPDMFKNNKKEENYKLKKEDSQKLSQMLKEKESTPSFDVEYDPNAVVKNPGKISDVVEEETLNPDDIESDSKYVNF